MPNVSKAKSQAYKDADWLRENYIVKGRSMPDIASECGVCTGSIGEYVRKHGLQLNKHRELSVQMTCSHCTKVYTLPRRNRDKYLKQSPDHKFFCSTECVTERRRTASFAGKDRIEMAAKALKTRISNGSQERIVKAWQEGRRKFQASPEGRRQVSKWQSAYNATPAGRERSRRGGVQSVLAQASGRETSIERIIRESLEQSGIRFEAQVALHYWVADFLLPDYNVVIEVNGDYWHANPLKYGVSDLNAMQRKNVARDKGKRAYLEKCGYTVLALWETDIHADLTGCMDVIRRSIAA